MLLILNGVPSITVVSRMSSWLFSVLGKTWDEIIPDEERKRIEEEELQQQLMELNLPPRSRKQIKKVSLRLLLFIYSETKCVMNINNEHNTNGDDKD